ncbi:glycosyltransferase, partial [Candidatus Uhrbacteria bacterium]|nr:glycosyltransferase [Candidatus Uhrbacteria bacterium]
MPEQKIALITIDYPPRRGGVARYLKNLVDASHGAMEVFQPEIKAGFFGWRSVIQLIRDLRRRGYQSIFVSHVLPIGTAAWIVQMFDGLPYTILCHGLDIQLASRSAWKRWLTRRILRAAVLIIANSEYTKLLLQQLDPGLSVEVLTPGVEPIDFLPHDEARRRLNIKEQECILLSVTRLVSRKGLDQLIVLLKELPSHVHYVMIGDGEDRERLQNLVKSQHIEQCVTFILQASDEERNLWYAAADIFVLPARQEGRDVEGF